MTLPWSKSEQFTGRSVVLQSYGGDWKYQRVTTWTSAETVRIWEGGKKSVDICRLKFKKLKRKDSKEREAGIGRIWNWPGVPSAGSGMARYKTVKTSFHKTIYRLVSNRLPSYP